jgi:hypothetical protein
LPPEVVYEAGWSSYEEYGHITIYEREDGTMYQVTKGYNVYNGEYDPGPEDITLEEALELIDEWEVIAYDNEDMWEEVGVYIDNHSLSL